MFYKKLLLAVSILLILIGHVVIIWTIGPLCFGKTDDSKIHYWTASILFMTLTIAGHYYWLSCQSLIKEMGNSSRSAQIASKYMLKFLFISTATIVIEIIALAALAFVPSACTNITNDNNYTKSNASIM